MGIDPSTHKPELAVGYSGNRYTPEAGEEILKVVKRAAKKPLSENELGTLLIRIDDLAYDYLLRRKFLTELPSPSERRKQLDDLITTIDRLNKTIAAIHSSLWQHISTRAKFSEEISRDFRALGMGMAEGDPIAQHLHIITELRTGAEGALSDLTDRKWNSGPAKQNAALRWFIGELANVFETWTDRKARANYSEHKARQTGLFVSFVESVLKPIDKESVNSGLGDIISRAIKHRAG